MKVVDVRADASLKDYMPTCVDRDLTLSKCKECGNYMNNWGCPAYDFDPVADIWNHYSTLRIVAKKIFADSGDDLNSVFFKVKTDLDNEMLELEKANPGSRALSAGFCTRCESCTRASGDPCRHPDKMRYSIESLGGLVDKTASSFLGFDLQWGKDGQDPDYYTLVGGLLLP